MPYENVLLRVGDYLWCRFAERNLIAHFLDSGSERFDLLLLLRDRRSGAPGQEVKQLQQTWSENPNSLLNPSGMSYNRSSDSANQVDIDGLQAFLRRCASYLRPHNARMLRPKRLSALPVSGIGSAGFLP